MWWENVGLVVSVWFQVVLMKDDESTALLMVFVRHFTIKIDGLNLK